MFRAPTASEQLQFSALPELPENKPEKNKNNRTGQKHHQYLIKSLHKRKELENRLFGLELYPFTEGSQIQMNNSG